VSATTGAKRSRSVDPEGGELAYAWDLDGNGSYETPGQTVAFSADDGNDVQDIAVRVTDVGRLTATDAAAVTITNVPPAATFGAPTTADASFAFALSLTSPHDPSTVTFTSLCDLVRAYSTDPRSPTTSAPRSSLTAEQVAELKLLSMRL
jgi:hypothetical protein